MSTEEANSKGPSKKELNKLARKEKRTGGSVEAPTDFAFTVAFSRDAALAPELTRAVDLFLGGALKVRYTNYLDASKSFPTLTSVAQPVGSVAGDANVARYLARANADAAALYGAGDNWLAAQMDQWLDVYSYAAFVPTYAASVPALLENVLATRTYLVGHALSLADIAVFVLLRKAKIAAETVNVLRWWNLVAARMPDLSGAIPTVFVAPVDKVIKQKEGKEPANKAVKSTEVAAATEAEIEAGSCPPLEGAVDGEVCTRFPPEPSGYLHIGHAKAVLLNQYYAQRYHGKMLIRFDDTNPSKEKGEYEDNILKDLETLGVKADKVSHSSDYFAKCEELARGMIKEGKAYMDDTDQETMQAERLERKESKCRNVSPEVNLALFEQLLKGESAAQKFCLRAKIDMQSVNGTMRDPVLYRFNDTPHHRTGTKHKAYPTYDFVCPILDAIEGVSHALRTTEYNDREEQYYWIQQAMNLRPVKITTFGKMNFVNTVLSKRKLNWFVEQNLVEGWFDPRFPTIQGCVRRGVNVEALKNFIISQGASRRVITMEWDKFWSENKKCLEEKCARYMGVHQQDVVVLTLENVAEEISAHSVQIHPSKPEMGNRVMRRFNKVYIDQIDAVTYSEGEEITLLRWGNMKLTKIEKDSSGKVLSMTGVYDATATNFSKTKKATWLAAVEDVVPVKFVEFDHLISKSKLGDEEDFKDFVNPVTRMESDGLADPCLRLLVEGDVIQLERKGFFRCDRPCGGDASQPVVLFAIPDGKAKSLNAVPVVAGGKKK